jgi:cytochrome c553
MRYQSGFSAVALALLCLSTTLADAKEEFPIPADEFVYCTTCHGVQLMGNPITRAPRLSGMDAWYIERQLQSFKQGWRGNVESDVNGLEMQPMAAVLSDEQITAVATFASMTRSPGPAKTVSGSIEKGRILFATCGACHGVSGEGNEILGGPALAGQNDWYIVTQLKNFMTGSRGGHPGDTNGMLMRASVQVLTDDDALRDVATYINSLQDK